jgi:hypothetical protein
VFPLHWHVQCSSIPTSGVMEAVLYTPLKL